MSNPLKSGHVELPGGGIADVVMAASAISAWSATNGAWTLVVLQRRYFPANHRSLPHRGAANAGETVALPAPEAAALVAAGFATAAAGAPSQSGDWTPT